MGWLTIKRCISQIQTPIYSRLTAFRAIFCNKNTIYSGLQYKKGCGVCSLNYNIIVPLKSFLRRLTAVFSGFYNTMV